MQLDELIETARKNLSKNNIKIVGFCGRKGAGKSTAEDYLIKNGFTETAFAYSLKKSASNIFGYDYNLLLGKTPEDREKREIWVHPVWEKTGREMLEYFGTEIMRNCFDKDVWVKSLLNNIISYDFTENRGIVITDCRFQNEIDILEKIGGKICIIYNYENDLKISDEDRKTHISNWGFLECKINDPLYIANDGTIADFYDKIKEKLLN